MKAILAVSVAITYEKQDEVLRKEHRNGVHKYKAYLQAGGSITGTTPVSTSIFDARPTLRR